MTKEMGLLWWMAKKGIAENATLALRRHQEKYGVAASVIYANPDDLKDQVITVEEITIRPEKSCLKDHLFVGRRIPERVVSLGEFLDERGGGNG